MQQRMTPFILLVWVLTCAIWSTVWLFIKLGVRDVPPAAFAVYRMAIALAVLVPVIVLRRTPWPRGRSEWVVVLSTGFVLLGVNYARLTDPVDRRTRAGEAFVHSVDFVAPC